MYARSPEPTQVQPHSPTELLLAWNTGEKFTLTFPELRFQCPCANCVDENTGRRMITRDQVKPDVRVTGAQVVGRYALQISFSDSHSTGMYHFDKLYQLCREAGKPAEIAHRA